MHGHDNSFQQKITIEALCVWLFLVDFFVYIRFYKCLKSIDNERKLNLHHNGMYLNFLDIMIELVGKNTRIQV